MATFDCSLADGLSNLREYAAATHKAASRTYSAAAAQVEPLVKDFVPHRRATRRDELLALIEDLQTRHDLLDEILRTLSTAQSTIRVYRDAVRQALAPISGLPVEILRNIFLFAVHSRSPDYGSEYYFRPINIAVTISRVCTQWRGIVKFSPELWLNIQVGPNDTEVAVNTCVSWAKLRRPSKPAVVGLVDWDEPVYRDSPAPVRSVPQGDFVLKLERGAQVDKIFRDLPSWRAWPSLCGATHLTIESTEEWPFNVTVESDDDSELPASGNEPPHYFDLDFTPFSNLESLRLVNLFLEGTFPAEIAEDGTLTKLACRQSSLYNIIWAGLRYLESLRLTQCDLLGRRQGGFYEVDLGPYVCPNLVTVVMDECEPRLVKRALANTRAPALGCLDIIMPADCDDYDWIPSLGYFIHLHVSEKGHIVMNACAHAFISRSRIQLRRWIRYG